MAEPRPGATAPTGRRRRPDQLSSGPHGLSREQVAANQSERIRAAMRDLVAAQGYDRTTVEQVIARAGVSRKTFYELRGGREHWFIAICDDNAAELREQVGQACNGGGGRRDRAERIAATLVGHCLGDPAGAQACFVETLAAGERARAWREELLQTLTREIAEAIGGAPVRDRDELAARAAVGAIVEIAGRAPDHVDGRHSTTLIATVLATGGAER